LVALSGEVSGPGDFKTLELAGAPLIIIRGRDGVVRGFRNSCAHRGAQVLSDSEGCGVRRIPCPSHGSTYDTEGNLVGVPFRQGSQLLIPGFQGSRRSRWTSGGVWFSKWSHPMSSMTSTSSWATSDRSWRNSVRARFEAAQPNSIQLKTNWKLAVDTFGENYNSPYGHTDTLMRVIVHGPRQVRGHLAGVIRSR
jgi:phenylpropionate dioxygenase-like ring-hydroxylating dioxygenase large terminal subunit